MLPLRAAESLDPAGRQAAFEHAQELRGRAVETGAIPAIHSTHQAPRAMPSTAPAPARTSPSVII